MLVGLGLLVDFAVAQQVARLDEQALTSPFGLRGEGRLASWRCASGAGDWSGRHGVS